MLPVSPPSRSAASSSSYSSPSPARYAATRSATARSLVEGLGIAHSSRKRSRNGGLSDSWTAPIGVTVQPRVQPDGCIRILARVLLGHGTGALVEPATGRAWTSAEITRRVSARAAQYRAGGVQRGDRVFLHFGNCNEFFVEVLAAWHVGACVVPIDPAFTPFEIETLADWAKPRLSVWLDRPGPSSPQRSSRAASRSSLSLTAIRQLRQRRRLRARYTSTTTR